MYSKIQLCDKIKALYPDIGQCCIDVDAEYDRSNNYWVVFLKKGEQLIKHFLPAKDADSCMDGKQCVGLGLEIAQFRD
jgi:hypothetical protein